MKTTVAITLARGSTRWTGGVQPRQAVEPVERGEAGGDGGQVPPGLQPHLARRGRHELTVFDAFVPIRLSAMCLISRATPRSTTTSRQ